MTSTRVSSKPSSPEAVLSHIEPGADIGMPNANGEPVELVDTLEEQAEELSGVWVPETMHTAVDLLLRRQSVTGMIPRWRYS
jgi:hypothetical protein